MDFFSATCPTVNVLNTNHWQQGDTGKYFYFAEEEFSTMVGYEDWSGKTFEVMQLGSQSWTGQVKVWKHVSGAHGRREPLSGASAGQWQTGDTIQYCPGIDQFITDILPDKSQNKHF